MPKGSAALILAIAVASSTPLSAQLTTVGNQRFDQAALGGTVEANDLFGAAFAVGDFDGDSYDDLAIGLPGEDIGAIDSAGEVIVVYGSPTGLNGTGSLAPTPIFQDATGVEDASEDGDQFGAALAAGDFNHDGKDDLAVGVPFEDVEDSPGVFVVDAGLIQIFYGSLTGIVLATDQVFHQESFAAGAVNEAGDQFGAALAKCSLGFASDVYDDLIVGMPDDNFTGLNNAGGVIGILGSASGLSTSGASYGGATGTTTAPAAGDRFGTSVSCAQWGAGAFERGFLGGAPDAEAFGAGNSAGIARLGANGSIFEIAPTQAGARTGASGVMAVSPVTSYDAFIGLPGYDSAGVDESGAIVEVSGIGILLAQGTYGLTETAEPFDHFGEVLATGDWNDDGLPDIAIGTPGENLRDGQPTPLSDAGTVQVLFNQSGAVGTAAHQTWNWDDPLFAFGAAQNDHFGGALAAGDFDGDGVADLAIGAPTAIWAAQAQTGLVQILYGEARLLLADNFEFGETVAWTSTFP